MNGILSRCPYLCKGTHYVNNCVAKLAMMQWLTRVHALRGGFDEWLVVFKAKESFWQAPS